MEVFMKAERIPLKNTRSLMQCEYVYITVKMVHFHSRYYNLDKEKSLRDNLVHKTVVEFPVLYVVLGSESREYPLYCGKIVIPLIYPLYCGKTMIPLVLLWLRVEILFCYCL